MDIRNNLFVAGLDDIMEVNNSGGKLFWFKNNANNTGITTAQNVIKPMLPYLNDFIYADLDNDGDIDILYYRTSFNEIGWFENTGNLTFTKHILGSVNRPYIILPLDLDADGNIDIIWGSNNLILLGRKTMEICNFLHQW